MFKKTLITILAVLALAGVVFAAKPTVDKSTGQMLMHDHNPADIRGGTGEQYPWMEYGSSDPNGGAGFSLVTDTGASLDLGVDNGAGTDAFIDSEGTDLLIQTNDAHGIGFQADVYGRGFTTDMYITKEGLVGIGTTDPVAQLDVVSPAPEDPAMVIVDDFNRADGAIGSNWYTSSNTELGTFVVAGNKMATTGEELSGITQTYWNGGTFLDYKVQFDLTAIPTYDTGLWWPYGQFYMRAPAKSDSMSAHEGYNFYIVPEDLYGGIQVCKVQGCGPDLASFALPDTIAVGDSYELSVVGYTLTIRYRPVGDTVWQTLASVVDPDQTFGSAGYFGFNVDSFAGTWEFDNFGIVSIGSETAIATKNGRVGIGKDAPRVDLDVVGDIAATGNIATSAGGVYGAGPQRVATASYVQSRGMNLVTNGSCLLGNNYNFSNMEFDPSEMHGGKGSFKGTGYNAGDLSHELIPVDPDKNYKLSVWAKSTLWSTYSRNFFAVAVFDSDGLPIAAEFNMRKPNTDTTLAADLHPGDTVIHLTSGANWYVAASQEYSRQIGFYDYHNSGGYLYPAYTYTRNQSGTYPDWTPTVYAMDGAWAENGISGNTITLTHPWPASLGTHLAGTPVSNVTSGSTNKYIAAAGINTPTTWTHYYGGIGGVDYTGKNNTHKFPPGAAFIRVMILLNYNSEDPHEFTSSVNVSDIWFGEVPSVVGGEVLSSDGSAETIASGATITADSCGMIKKIRSDSAISTSATHAFTTPSVDTRGCCMDVINDGGYAITVKNHSAFYTAGGTDVVLGSLDTMRVCGEDNKWVQIGSTGNN